MSERTRKRFPWIERWWRDRTHQLGNEAEYVVTDPELSPRELLAYAEDFPEVLKNPVLPLLELEMPGITERLQRRVGRGIAQRKWAGRANRSNYFFISGRVIRAMGKKWYQCHETRQESLRGSAKVMRAFGKQEIAQGLMEWQDENLRGPQPGGRTGDREPERSLPGLGRAWGAHHGARLAKAPRSLARRGAHDLHRRAVRGV
jgi:hypothetical protein